MNWTNGEHAKELKRAIAEERERCAKVAEDWLKLFATREPQYVSAQDWANDAVRDIVDAIRVPTPPTRTET